jgi:hypothetical protein
MAKTANKWLKGTFRILKIKVKSDVHKKYQKILDLKGWTMQRDIEEHINSVIK